MYCLWIVIIMTIFSVNCVYVCECMLANHFKTLKQSLRRFNGKILPDPIANVAGRSDCNDNNVSVNVFAFACVLSIFGIYIKVSTIKQNYIWISWLKIFKDIYREDNSVFTVNSIHTSTLNFPIVLYVHIWLCMC